VFLRRSVQGHDASGLQQGSSALSFRSSTINDEVDDSA
jgi:hypothetical protein